MENLHLKNLTTNKLIDYYINQIEKINTKNNNFKSAHIVSKVLYDNADDIINDFEILTKLLTKLYNTFIIELKRIDIINPQIKTYRNHSIGYIEDIIHYNIKELKIHNYIDNYFYNEYKSLTNIFKHEINHLNLLKNIDINSKWIDIDYEYQYPYGEDLSIVALERTNHLTTLTHDLTITVNKENIIEEIITNHH
jgi:hypothetical protein